MASRPVFSKSRKELLIAVLTAAGATSALTACSSNEATYRPAPQATTTTGAAKSCGAKCGAKAPAQPTYTQPAAQPTYRAPAAPPPPPAGGQMACGKGKCG